MLVELFHVYSYVYMYKYMNRSEYGKLEGAPVVFEFEITKRENLYAGAACSCTLPREVSFI